MPLLAHFNLHLILHFPLDNFWHCSFFFWSRCDDTWPKLNCIKTQWVCIFSQWSATVGFEPLTLGQCHRHWATKACFEHIHFTDGEWGSSCPVPFKFRSSHLWHDWLHMTSPDRHVSLCTAIRNALLAVQRSLMPHVYNIIEALRWVEWEWKREWQTKPWILSEMFVAL